MTARRKPRANSQAIIKVSRHRDRQIASGRRNNDAVLVSTLTAKQPTGRSSGSRIGLLTAPSHRSPRQWHVAAFVPGYSGGSATDSHRLPYSSAGNTPTDTSVEGSCYRGESEKQSPTNNFSPVFIRCRMRQTKSHVAYRENETSLRDAEIAQECKLGLINLRIGLNRCALRFPYSPRPLRLCVR